jgi:glycosyltransferase involved in cell wall biosynthesis
MKIDIYIPCYNSETSIMDVVESILKQTHQEFHVVFYNNSSTDLTQEICETVCSADSRFSLVNREKNIGAFLNIHSIITNKNNGFFALLADDMVIEPTYIEKCVKSLLDRPDTAICYTGVKAYQSGKHIATHFDKYSLMQNEPHQRLISLTNNLSLGTALYGVFRAELLQDLSRFWQDLAVIRLSDLQFLVKVVIKAKIFQVEEALIQRKFDKAPLDYYEHLKNIYYASYTRKLVPFISAISYIGETIFEDLGCKDTVEKVTSCLINKFKTEVDKEYQDIKKYLAEMNVCEKSELLKHMIFIQKYSHKSQETNFDQISQILSDQIISLSKSQ